MTAIERLEIKKRIKNASDYYRSPMTADAIEWYVKLLEGFSFEEISNAMNSYARNPKNKFMFNAADLIGIIRPEPDEDSYSREIASKITKAITKFGWVDSSGAREFIGELGWTVVDRKGGWAYICQNHGHILDSTTFEAQCRELVKVEIKAKNNPYYMEMLSNVSKGMSLNEAIQKSESNVEERKKVLLDQAKKLEGKS